MQPQGSNPSTNHTGLARGRLLASAKPETKRRPVWFSEAVWNILREVRAVQAIRRAIVVRHIICLFSPVGLRKEAALYVAPLT